MKYIDAQENCSGLANQSKQIRAVMLSRKRHWNQLVTMPDRCSSSSGSEGSQVSPRVTKRGNSKPDASPFCGLFPRKRIVVDSYSSSHVYFLTNWFVASPKFGVDDGIAVVAAEDDATVSLITDVSIVQQKERFFALMDSISLSSDFEGRVPSEKPTDLPNRALRGDCGSAEHVTKTSARICTPWSCCLVESPFSKGSVSRWRRNATCYAKVFVFSGSERRSQLGHTVGPS